MSTALRLARQQRGDATVSETMNSNTINLVGGVVIPAAILGVGTVTHGVMVDLAWLAALTGWTLLALAGRRGMGRLAGSVLIVGYLAFVATHVF